jgi:hypothetical protein
MKCPNCGSENDESRFDCWKCGRHFAGASSPYENAPPPDHRDQGIAHKTVDTRRAASPPRYASTIAALAGLILLIVALVLSIYQGEKFLEFVNSPEHGIGEWQSLSDTSNAIMYFLTLGDITVILALVLLTLTLTNEQQEGWGVTILRQISLVNVKRLLLLGLAAMIASLILWVCLSEGQISLDTDMMMRLSNSVSYLSQVAWILVTSAILLVANGLRNGDRSGSEGTESEPKPVSGSD